MTPLGVDPLRTETVFDSNLFPFERKEGGEEDLQSAARLTHAILQLLSKHKMASLRKDQSLLGFNRRSECGL